MTHEEKWKRIGEIDSRLNELDAERRRLVSENDDLLMTRASDETEYLTLRKARVDR